MTDRIRIVFLIEEIRVESKWSIKEVLRRIKISVPTHNRMRDEECRIPLSPMTQKKLKAFFKKHGRKL